MPLIRRVWQAFETEPQRIKALPFFGPQFKVIGGRRCRVDKPKWRGRQYREPFKEYDVAWAARGALEALVSLRNEEQRNLENPKVIPPENYFEPDAKIVGVWAAGSGVAGRYTKASDIDIWIQVEGLTSTGDDYAWQDINNYNDENGVKGYAGGQERRIDTIVNDYSPPEEECRYDLINDPDLRDYVRAFNDPSWGGD